MNANIPNNDRFESISWTAVDGVGRLGYFVRRYRQIPSTWRSTIACLPSSERRNRQSSFEPIKKFSTSTAAGEDVEVGFEVGGAVGVVGAEVLAGEVEPGGFVEAGGEPDELGEETGADDGGL